MNEIETTRYAQFCQFRKEIRQVFSMKAPECAPQAISVSFSAIKGLRLIPAGI